MNPASLYKHIPHDLVNDCYRKLPSKAEAFVITFKGPNHKCSSCQNFVENNQKCSIICGKVCCQICSSIFGVNVTYEDGPFSGPNTINCFGISKIVKVEYVS